MRVRRLAAVMLVSLLATPPMAPAAEPAPQPPAPGGLQVYVDPTSACVLAGEYPQFEGAVVPTDGVTRVRLFFRSAPLSQEFYYVEGVQAERGRYVIRLPRPRFEAGPIIFYLEATKSDYSQGRSLEGNAVVVRKVEQCPGDRKAAPIAPGQPVSVFDLAGNQVLPAGFEAAGAVAGATAGVGTAAAAGGASFITSTAGLITLGAIAVGITAIVIATDEPNSPSR